VISKGGEERSIDAVWTYETPYAAVTDIKDHLTFYPDRVDAIEISGDIVRVDNGSKL
jgi:uncharacterized protein (DUF427 family)